MIKVYNYEKLYMYKLMGNKGSHPYIVVLE